jgi:hypothetical protein
MNSGSEQTKSEIIGYLNRKARQLQKTFGVVGFLNEHLISIERLFKINSGDEFEVPWVS